MKAVVNPITGKIDFVEEGGALAVPAGLGDLNDVDLTGAAINDTLIRDGSGIYHSAPPGTSFAFALASFTQTGIAALTQRMGVANATFLDAGDVSFSASYTNGPADSAAVTHSGWSSLSLTGAGHTGPTASVSAMLFPSAAGGTSVFTITAVKGSITRTGTITVTFPNDRFYGVSTNDALTTADIDALVTGGDLVAELVNSKAKSWTANPSATEYVYFIYPSRFGQATYTIGGFAGGVITLGTGSYTNALGFTETFRIDRSLLSGLNNPAIVAS